ncbi:MAG: autotransporter-associated beta strand repeat-containing protein [Akkermansiaceae bacterium]|nr:autotransporter-associated beta strand repeat-containing protein [Akkermansiaceae bacterium]
MKIRHLPTSLSVFASLAVGHANADILTWDNVSTDGLWNQTSNNWGGSLWSNANPDDAIFGATGAGTVTLGENITVGNITFSAAGYTIAGGGNSLALSSPSTITADSDATISAVLSGGGLTKEGGGILTLSATNTYTGDTVINNGTLNITGSDYTQKIAPGSAITVNSGATLKYSAGVNSLQRNAGDAMITLNGGILDYAAPTHGHMGNITLQNGASWIASGGGGYSGENMQLNGTVTVSGTSASTIGAFSQGLALNGNREFNVADVTGNSSTDLTVIAELENNDSGPGDGVIKTGAGTMLFSSTGKSYSGETVVNDGTLVVSTTLRSTSGVTVGSGAVAEFGATNIFVGGHGTALDNGRVLTANGGTLLMNGSFDSRFGNVALNDGATWTSNRVLTGWDALMANTSAGAATVTVGGTGASTMNGSGGVHLQGVQNFNVGDASGDAGGDLFVNMTLDNGGLAGGTGGVNKLGDGRMVIQKRMTYTGGTTVNAGVLEIAGGGNASAGAIRGALTINDGGRVELNFSDALGYGSGSDSISAININGGGVLHRIGGANETLGSVAITMDGGTISSSDPAQRYDLFGGGTSVTVNNASGLGSNKSVISARVDLRQANVDFTVNENATLEVGVLGLDTPGATMTKKGIGTMVITDASDYNGATNIQAGTLALGSGGSISDSPTIDVLGGATFDVSAVSGGFSLGNGQTLMGAGTVVGPIQAALGSTIAPGASPGTLNFDDNLTIAGGAIMMIELTGTSNGAYDILKGDGANALAINGGTLNLDTTGYTATLGDSFVIFENWGSITGAGFDSINGIDLGAGLKFDTANLNTTGTLNVVAIPEPGSALMLALGGLGLLARRKRG